MTEKEFVQQRVGFAFVCGKLYFQKDRKSTIPWLKEEFGLSDDTIEGTIRGGIFSNHINFCIGSDYREVDLSKISAEDFISIIKRHSEEFPGFTAKICNGAIKGEIGNEWEPRQYIGKVMFI